MYCKVALVWLLPHYYSRKEQDSKGKKSIKITYRLTTYRLKGTKVCFLLTNNYNINWIHSKAKQQCSHKSIPLVGMLFCWSISRAEKLYRTIMSSTTERHPGAQTIQSTTCERYSEWLHHFLPFPLLRPESKQGYKKTPMGCGRFVSSANSLNSQHSLLSSHLRLTQQKDCAAQGGRDDKKRQRSAFPTEGVAWNEIPQAAGLPHSPRDTAIAQQTSLSEGPSLLCAAYLIF